MPAEFRRKRDSGKHSGGDDSDDDYENVRATDTNLHYSLLNCCIDVALNHVQTSCAAYNKTFVSSLFCPSWWREGTQSIQLISDQVYWFEDYSRNPRLDSISTILQGKVAHVSEKRAGVKIAQNEYTQASRDILNLFFFYF